MLTLIICGTSETNDRTEEENSNSTLCCPLTWLPQSLDITCNDVGGAGVGFPHAVTPHHVPLMRVLKYVQSDGCAPEEALIDVLWVFSLSSQSSCSSGAFCNLWRNENARLDLFSQINHFATRDSEEMTSDPS